jgi:putative transposase
MGGGGWQREFKGSHLAEEILLWGVRWSVAYPTRYRRLEEVRGERKVTVAPSTLTRWVIMYAPKIETQFRRQQRPVGEAGVSTKRT